MFAKSLAALRTPMGRPTSMLKRLVWASISRANICMSPMRPAQATPMLSVTLKTFLPPRLMIKLP